MADEYSHGGTANSYRSLYVDIRLTPGTNPLDVREELVKLLSQAGLEGNVDLYLHRPGFEGNKVDELLKDLNSAHTHVAGAKVECPPDIPITSMWRDTNCYAEFGIPALNFGPGGGAGSGAHDILIADLVKASKIYALTAFYVCRRARIQRH